MAPRRREGIALLPPVVLHRIVRGSVVAVAVAVAVASASTTCTTRTPTSSSTSTASGTIRHHGIGGVSLVIKATACIVSSAAAIVPGIKIGTGIGSTGGGIHHHDLHLLLLLLFVEFQEKSSLLGHLEDPAHRQVVAAAAAAAVLIQVQVQVQVLAGPRNWHSKRELMRDIYYICI